MKKLFLNMKFSPEKERLTNNKKESSKKAHKKIKYK